jgi:hypothetical protein
MERLFLDLSRRAEAESREGHEQYQGQRLAGFDPAQQASFEAARAVGERGVPQALQTGIGRATDVAGYQQQYDPGQVRTDLGASMYDPGQIRTDIAASQYAPGQFGVGSWVDPGVAQQYMNPFIKNVIDVQESRARQQFAEDVTPAMAAKAVQAGAFGGSRAALQEQLATERLNQRLADMRQTGMAGAYETGQKAHAAEAARQLKEQQFADAAAQQAAKLGISRAELIERGAARGAELDITGQKLGLSAAQQLAAFGGLEQQYGLRSADALRQVGEQRRAFEQQQYDLAYSDFLTQRDYLRQQLGWLGGIMHGVPTPTSEERVTFRQQPSAAQQMLGYGLGLGGLGRNLGIGVG